MIPPTFKTQRLYSIDALRGVAALAIVVWHWQHFFAIHGTWMAGWNRGQEPFYIWLKPLYEYGWAAVDLFFAVSGFVFYWLYLEPVANREIGPGRFALQRFSRLYPIYFLTLIVAAGLQFLFHRATGSFFIFDANDWQHFIRSLFLVQQWAPPDEMQSFNGPAWAVSIEVMLYLIFFAGAWLKVRGPLPAAIMVLVGFVIFPWEGQIARGISAFFMGALVFYAARGLSKKTGAKPIAIGVAVAALLAWIVAIVEVYLGPIGSLIRNAPAPVMHFFTDNYGRNEYQLFMYAWILVVAPLTLLTLALHEEVFAARYERLSYLGDISYSTYMVHFPMQLSLALLALRFGWTPGDFMSGLAMLLFYAAMIGLGSLSYTYFERPTQAFIRDKIFAGPRASEHA